MFTGKKIDAMHAAYGVFTGVKCKTCPHLAVYSNADGNRHWYKCCMYGVSNGPGTDWRVGYEACGAFTTDPEEAERNGLYGNVYWQIKGLRPKQPREEIPGQTQMAI